MSEEAVNEVMKGIAGWHRWSAWAAHFFVDGKHICNTVHSYAEGGMARGLPPVAPKPVDIASSGVPFGRVCQRCLKLTRQAPK